jgi:hypothetical protein
VRLGTCIALELVVAAGAAGGLWLGLGRAGDVAGEYFAAREAEASTAPPPRVSAVGELPSGRLAVAAPGVRTVFPAPDGELLAPLAATGVRRVKLNHGGTSLSLRLEFANGARAAFKPMQIHPQSDPRREIAAYRIDRLLGIGHVAPAKAAVFTLDELAEAADPAAYDLTFGRISDEAIVRDGLVRGELSWWIPEIKGMRFGGELVDEPAGVDIWSALLQPGVQATPAQREVLAQLATCVVFDVVVDNADRWSGNNTQSSPDDRVLYFMDNTLSFSLFTKGHAMNLAKLYRIGVFPRGLIARLRALTYESIASAIAEDSGILGPLLTDGEIRALLARRDHVLEYVDGVIAEHGEGAVLALP